MKTSQVFPLDNSKTIADTLSAMPKTITIRPNAEDRKIIDRLAAKMGIKTSQVIKIALRHYAEASGLKLRAS